MKKFKIYIKLKYHWFMYWVQYMQSKFRRRKSVITVMKGYVSWDFAEMLNVWKILNDGYIHRSFREYVKRNHYMINVSSSELLMIKYEYFEDIIVNI